RRAPRALRQLGARPGVNLELQDASRALDDPLQLWLAVEVEPVDRAEAVAHRAAEQPLARGGADAREAWELEAHGARAGPLAGHVVEAEVLKSWVERLLDQLVQPVDLVDEEDVAVLLVQQHGRQRAGVVDRGATCGLDGDAKLVGDDV